MKEVGLVRDMERTEEIGVDLVIDTTKTEVEIGREMIEIERERSLNLGHVLAKDTRRVTRDHAPGRDIDLAHVTSIAKTGRIRSGIIQRS